MSQNSEHDDFSAKLPHRNLGLEAEGKTFWVPRDTLAEFSPIFARMLYGEFKEANQDVIKIPGKKSEDVLEVLRCLFRIKQVTAASIDVVLQFADEYQIKILTEECKKLLMENLQSVEQIVLDKKIKLFLTGVRYRFSDLVRRLLPSIARHELDELEHYFGEMSDCVKLAIFAQIAGQLTRHQTRHQLQVRSYGIGSCCVCVVFCRFCYRPTRYTWGNNNGEFCTCVNRLAAAELKKIGLYVDLYASLVDLD